MVILTLGPQGSFSHEAATKLHPKKKIDFASSIDEVFFRLAEKEISEAIIPIEKGDRFIEGSIANLMKYDFSITRKTTMKISYHLVAREEPIDHLFVDPYSLEGCRTKIKELCRRAKKVNTPAMAYSAIQYKALPKKSAAIVSPYAASYYDLPIFAENIEDDEENFATFFAIGKSPPKKKKKNGTAFLIFSDPMATIAKQISEEVHERKIPLLKLKNLLLQEGHTPLYFMEVEGHLEERMIRSLFEVLSDKYLIKHLGSYPL